MYLVVHRESVPYSMTGHWLTASVLVGALLFLGSGHRVAPTSHVEPAINQRVALKIQRTDMPDTVRTSTENDTPVILSLPQRLNDASVNRYGILSAPALTGVADRSFTWIPAGSPSGTYEARLEAHRSDGATDTLVVRIRLER